GGPTWELKAAKAGLRLPLEHVVEGDEWCEQRVMLAVESEMAAAVGGARGRWRRRGRPAAKVDDLDRRDETDPTSSGPNRRAEVHIFRVHEETLVEQADRFGIGAPDHEARPAHPVGRLRLASHHFHVSTNLR